MLARSTRDLTQGLTDTLGLEALIGQAPRYLGKPLERDR